MRIKCIVQSRLEKRLGMTWGYKNKINDKRLLYDPISGTWTSFPLSLDISSIHTLKIEFTHEYKENCKRNHMLVMNNQIMLKNKDIFLLRKTSWDVQALLV